MLKKIQKKVLSLHKIKESENYNVFCTILNMLIERCGLQYIMCDV